MKSENNNSFTISPTNGGDQEYIIFNKVKEKEPSEDRLIKGSGYWGMYNVQNYTTVKNPFDESTQFLEPQDPLNAKFKSVYKETLENKQNSNLDAEPYYLTEDEDYISMAPLANMESLTWKSIEPLFNSGGYGGLSVKYAKSISSFFINCKKLRWCYVAGGLKLTKNTKSANTFFSGCIELRAIKGLTTWDISNITDFASFFFNCKKLEEINISNWNTSNVTDMRNMFGLCSNLKTIYGVIDLSSVEEYDGMFTSCDKLTGLKLKNVPTGFDFGRAGLTPGQYEIVDPFYIHPTFYEFMHGSDTTTTLIADWGSEEERESDVVPME